MKIFWTMLVLTLLPCAQAMAEVSNVIAAFGDSLTAGYGLKPEDAFPAQLEQKFTNDGYRGVRVINDGAVNNSTADALARIQVVLLQHPYIVIIQLGGVDFSKGIPIEETRKNLDEIMNRFRRAKIKIFLTGQKPDPKAPPEYAAAFKTMYAELAKEYDAIFYSNFMEGMDGILGMMQPDGIHPSREGTAVITGGIAGRLQYELKK